MSIFDYHFKDENLDRFLQVKSTMSEAGRKSYTHLLVTFDQFMATIGVNSLTIPPEELAVFYNRYRSSSMNTRRSYYIILNVFFKWLQEEELRAKNPVKNLIHKGESRKKDKPTINDQDFLDIAARCEGLRESAIVWTEYYTGMRASELEALKIEDVNISENYIYVGLSKSKTGNRPIPILTQLQPLLKEYYRRRTDPEFFDDVIELAAKRGAKFKVHDFFFTNAQKRPLKYRTHLELIHKVTGKKFATHDFRRALVTNIYEATQDIVLAQQIAGHSGIETTRRYVKNDRRRLKKFEGLEL